MAIIPWRPFWNLERWFEEDWPEEWFGPRWGRLLKVFEEPTMRTPRMDIYEDNGNLVAEVELPGMKPENIKVEVKDNTLCVEAEAEEKKEEKKRGYYRKELGKRYFRRLVPLPVEVEDEKTEATYGDGILRVVIPKVVPKKEKKKKAVKVKVRKK